MRKKFVLFSAALLLGTSAPPTRAQGLDGTVRGNVRDPQGAIVVGAKVVVSNEQTDLQRTQETTSGGFSFPNLLSGTYKISVEHEGFKKYVVRGIEIKANQVTDLTVVLELGPLTQAVEVSASGELVQTTSSQLGTSWAPVRPQRCRSRFFQAT